MVFNCCIATRTNFKTQLRNKLFEILFSYRFFCVMKLNLAWCRSIRWIKGARLYRSPARTPQMGPSALPRWSNLCCYDNFQKAKCDKNKWPFRALRISHTEQNLWDPLCACAYLVCISRYEYSHWPYTCIKNVRKIYTKSRRYLQLKRPKHIFVILLIICKQ